MKCHLKILACLTIAVTFTLQATKEIELKIRITNDQHNILISWLEENAIYKGTSKQQEFYLRHPNDTWDTSKGFKDTLRTLRVRFDDRKGASVCHKYRHIDPTTGKTTHREENETKIENGQEMLAILHSLEYTHETVIKKIRTTYLVDDLLEIVLDDVEGLGHFVEIELKQPTDDVYGGIVIIENFLRGIGLTEFVEFDRSYIHMIWNPEYNFGTQRTLLN